LLATTFRQHQCIFQYSFGDCSKTIKFGALPFIEPLLLFLILGQEAIYEAYFIFLLIKDKKIFFKGSSLISFQTDLASCCPQRLERYDVLIALIKELV
jgi:hypothetical protein